MTSFIIKGNVRSDGSASSSSANTGIRISGKIVLGAKGDKGDKGDQGDPATNLVTSVNGRQGVVTGLAEQSDLTDHVDDTSNPHSVTKSQVGLGNVDNTSDASKPISTATQSALDGKANANATVNLTGNQTVAGIKTFSSSPIVPTATTGTSTVNKAQMDAADALKVDKTSVFNAVYGTDGAGGQVLYGISQNPNNLSVAMRRTGGTLDVNTPTSSLHAANKSYVDGKVRFTQQIVRTPSQSTDYFELLRTSVVGTSAWGLLVFDVFNTIAVTNWDDIQYSRYKVSTRTTNTGVPTDLAYSKVYGDDLTDGIITLVANTDGSLSIWGRAPSLAYRTVGLTSAYAMSNAGAALGLTLPLTSQVGAPTGAVVMVIG